MWSSGGLRACVRTGCGVARSRSEAFGEKEGSGEHNYAQFALIFLIGEAGLGRCI